MAFHTKAEIEKSNRQMARLRARHRREDPSGATTVVTARA